LFLGSKLTEKTQIKSMADHVRFNPFLRLWLPDYYSLPTIFYIEQQ